MNWDAYTALMAANGQPVYATRPGHHGVYEGVEHTTPTTYPHRRDTHEMRLEWVMTREVYPRLRGIKEGPYHLRCLSLDHVSPLLATMLADITRRLVGDGYHVAEETHAYYGWTLRVTWPQSGLDSRPQPC